MDFRLFAGRYSISSKPTLSHCRAVQEPQRWTAWTVNREQQVRLELWGMDLKKNLAWSSTLTNGALLCFLMKMCWVCTYWAYFQIEKSKKFCYFWINTCRPLGKPSSTRLVLPFHNELYLRNSYIHPLKLDWEGLQPLHVHRSLSKLLLKTCIIINCTITSCKFNI